jgi:hypothetical protein
VEDQNAERPAGLLHAAGGSPISTMLGSTRYQDTALSVTDQGSTADPIGAPEDPTAASRRFVFDQIVGTADLLESFAICFKEAARRDDRVRVHGYIADIVQCVTAARGAYDPDPAGETRWDIFARFSSGDTKVICNVNVLTTGVDLEVRCIVDAQPTKSRILFVQKIGRGLRTATDKDRCVIIDHAGNHLRLGRVTDIHQTHLDDGQKRDGSEKKEERVEPLPKLCPECKAVLAYKARARIQISVSGTMQIACGICIGHVSINRHKRIWLSAKRSRRWWSAVRFGGRLGLRSLHRSVPMPRTAQRGHCHVWMAPADQGLFRRCAGRGCGHVFGL